MNLKEVKVKRIKALKNAYEQLETVLTEKVDWSGEVDPEKRKIALSAYKQAAEDSKTILHEIIELEGKMIIDVTEYESLVANKDLVIKVKQKGLSPEQRIKR